MAIEKAANLMRFTSWKITEILGFFSLDGLEPYLHTKLQGEARRRVIRGGVMEEETASNAWYDLEVERRWKGEKPKKKSKNLNINMLNIRLF